MVSFNILGVCTSRDIFSRTNSKDKYEVYKYTFRFSPLFVFEGGVDITYKEFIDIISEQGIAASNFVKRSFYLEITRRVFKFISEKKSDYLLLDMSMQRSSCFMTEDGKFYYQTKKNIEMYNALVKKLHISPIVKENIKFNSFDKEECIARLKKYAEKILEIYKPSQIILCNHLNSQLVNKKGRYIRIFNNIRAINEKNDYIDFCFNVMKNYLFGCHVIDYLKNSVADAEHPLGLSPLHYTNLYYEYHIECIDLITKKIPLNEELNMQKMIARKYNRRYAVHYFEKLKKLIICKVGNSITVDKILYDSNNDEMD